MVIHNEKLRDLAIQKVLGLDKDNIDHVIEVLIDTPDIYFNTGSDSLSKIELLGLYYKARDILLNEDVTIVRFKIYMYLESFNNVEIREMEITKPFEKEESFEDLMREMNLDL